MVEDLTLFGQRIVSEVENLGRAAELHPPTLRYTSIVMMSILLFYCNAHLAGIVSLSNIRVNRNLNL